MFDNLLHKIRLPFRKDRELYSSLYKILGFYPKDIAIYRQALTHKSQKVRQDKDRRRMNNERLEFLGDAVIAAIVSDVLYHRFSTKGEGFLTNTRSKVVQRESLNRLADQLGVTRLVSKSHSVTDSANNIGGNALEALVGAVYLDRGYTYCKRFISRRILASLGDLDKLAQKEMNYKSKLIEWCQKERFTLQFRLLNEEQRRDNTNAFATMVTVEGIDLGEGEGNNKKDSHQKAAFVGWERIKTEPKLLDQLIAARNKRLKREEENKEFTVPGLQRTNDGTAVKAEERRRENSRKKQKADQAEKTEQPQKANTSAKVEQDKGASRPTRQPLEVVEAKVNWDDVAEDLVVVTELESEEAVAARRIAAERETSEQELSSEITVSQSKAKAESGAKAVNRRTAGANKRHKVADGAAEWVDETTDRADETTLRANEATQLANETVTLADQTAEQADETAKWVDNTSELADEITPVADVASENADNSFDQAEKTVRSSNRRARSANRNKKSVNRSAEVAETEAEVVVDMFTDADFSSQLVDNTAVEAKPVAKAAKKTSAAAKSGNRSAESLPAEAEQIDPMAENVPIRAKKADETADSVVESGKHVAQPGNNVNTEADHDTHEVNEMSAEADAETPAKRKRKRRPHRRRKSQEQNARSAASQAPSE